VPGPNGKPRTGFDPNKTVFLFRPPHPVKRFYYRCDNKFHLDALLKLCQPEVGGCLGVILISGNQSLLYKVGSAGIPQRVHSMEVDLPNRQRKGGQSAVRFERLTEEKRYNYVKKVGALVEHKLGEAIGLILAGPAELKQDLQAYLEGKFKVLRVETTDEMNAGTIHSVLAKCVDVVMELSSKEEKAVMQEVKTYLNTAETIDRVVFGIEEVMTALEAGQLKKILVGVGLNDTQNERLKTGLTKRPKTEAVKITSTLYGPIIGITFW
jgi:peptide subunit release factor 1 (eRF1)